MMREIRCRGLIGNQFTPEFIFLTETHAFFIDVPSLRCVGTLPIHPDTDKRVAFGPDAGTCIIGSWREKLQAWNFLTSTLLWTSELTHITHIDRFGNEQIKIKKDGSIILSAQTGEILTAFPWIDIYKHPTRPVTVSFDRVNRILSLSDVASGKTSNFDWDTFALFSYAWSNDAFIAAEPGGQIRAYSINDPAILLDQPRSTWFNVRELCFNEDSNTLFGVGTGWKGNSANAVIRISADFQSISLIRELPNDWHFCFFDAGRFVLIADGSLFDVAENKLVHKFEWNDVLE